MLSNLDAVSFSDVMAYISKEKLSPKPAKLAPPVQPASAAQSRPSAATTTGAFHDIPLSNMRSTIAKRLSASKNSIPHSYLSAAISADNVLKLRKTLAKDGVKVSVNDFIIKAVGMALRVSTTLTELISN